MNAAEMESKPIAFYSNPSSFGGSEVYLKQLIDPLSLNGWSVTFIGGDDHPLREWLREEHSGVHYISLGSLGLMPVEVSSPASKEGTRASPPEGLTRFRRTILKLMPESVKLVLGTLRDLIQVSNLFRRSSIHHIHFNDSGCEPAVIAARLAGVRRITGTFHVAASDDSFSLHWFRRVIEYISVRCFDEAIAVSHATKESWVSRTGWGSSKISVIHNGVDQVSLRKHCQERNEFLLCLGLAPAFRYAVVPARLHWMKGHETLLRAISGMADHCDDVRFVLVGDGGLRGELEALAEDLGVFDLVRFVGYSDQVPSWISASEFVVLPSVALEACPLSILESMALGKAVVSTRVGGIPELVKNDVNGYVVEPAVVDELKDAVVKLIESPALCEEMGRQGATIVTESFLLHHAQRKTEQFLGEGL